MSPNVDKECVTHHYACDCREERFRVIEKALELASRWDGKPIIANGLILEPREGYWMAEARKSIEKDSAS
jgi:hypothetical protein